MSTIINMFLFGVYPYVALAVCLLGCWARFDLSQYTWKTGSSQMLRTRNMRLASNLFHVGIIFVLMGHLVGLQTPEGIYHHVITTENKQLVAMVSGGIFGMVCLVGLVMLLWRRMTDPRIRATSSFSDILVLWLLLIQLLLGLGTIYASTSHMDGAVMRVLGLWAQHLTLMQPTAAASFIENTPLIYRLHVFLGVTLILIFPFTRLVHIISAPIWYLGRRYQIVRQKSS